MYKKLAILFAILLGPSCSNTETVVFGALSTFTESGVVQMVVEIPAGTNKKIEYDYKSNSFKNDQKNGKNRVIQFLPYLGNYGFIPSTNMDKSLGGDGDALDVLVLASAQPTGTILRVIPIGLLKLSDNGEIDNKIIAIPAEAQDRIIDVISFRALRSMYPEVPNIIEHWFLDYKGNYSMELVGWGDEGEAREEIQKWLINY